MRKIAVLTVVLLMTGLCLAQVAVIGHVYAISPSTTSRPIAGAAVMLISSNPTPMPPVYVYRTTSGRDGSFLFSTVRPGTYQLVAQARGFAQARPVQVVISATSPVTRVVADVFMVPIAARPVEEPVVTPRASGD